MSKTHNEIDCPCNGRDAHGRCLGACYECKEHLLSTGRYTTYCPSCNVCATCECPQVDGFMHNVGCADDMGCLEDYSGPNNPNSEEFDDDRPTLIPE